MVIHFNVFVELLEIFSLTGVILDEASNVGSGDSSEEEQSDILPLIGKCHQNNFYFESGSWNSLNR